MIKFFITRILAWAAGLTKADFQTASALVLRAEADYESSADKRKFVLGQLKFYLPGIATWALGLLLELAVAHFNKSQAS